MKVLQSSHFNTLYDFEESCSSIEEKFKIDELKEKMKLAYFNNFFKINKNYLQVINEIVEFTQNKFPKIIEYIKVKARKIDYPFTIYEDFLILTKFIKNNRTVFWVKFARKFINWRPSFSVKKRIDFLNNLSMDNVHYILKFVIGNGILGHVFENELEKKSFQKYNETLIKKIKNENNEKNENTINFDILKNNNKLLREYIDLEYEKNEIKTNSYKIEIDNDNYIMVFKNIKDRENINEKIEVFNNNQDVNLIEFNNNEDELTSKSGEISYLNNNLEYEKSSDKFLFLPSYHENKNIISHRLNLIIRKTVLGKRESTVSVDNYLENKEFMIRKIAQDYKKSKKQILFLLKKLNGNFEKLKEFLEENDDLIKKRMLWTKNEDYILRNCKLPSDTDFMLIRKYKTDEAIKERLKFKNYDLPFAF